MIIRQCLLEDFSGVVALHKQLWPDKNSDEVQLFEVYRKSLDSKTDILLCVEHKEAIVGFAAMIVGNSFWVEGSIAYITTLVVDIHERNKGIGSHLIETLCQLAAKNNCKRIELDSALTRERAHLFYKQLGFEKRAFTFSKQL